MIECHAALEQFLGALAAKDSSPHTSRAYATAVDDFFAWLERSGVASRVDATDAPPAACLPG